MTVFTRELKARNHDPKRRRWFFVPYDQLTDTAGPLAELDPRETGIVVVENPWKAARRPYHQQKLALVLANLRHFALEQAARGVAVRHVVARGPYATALEPLARELGAITLMEPAERELRRDLAALVAAGALRVVPHAGWLTTADDFRRACPKPPYRMDVFYRHARRAAGVLVDDAGKPRGGKWSYDTENRRPWRGQPPAAEPPRFTPDAVTREVGALVAERFGHHPGTLDLEALPATAADAEAVWRWARRACLPHFGPFEDAMSRASTTLFHSRVSQLVNLHRLLPRRLVTDAAALDLPLASQEGFIRQLLGWREFVHHVHVATDGFRDPRTAVAPRPGHGGYARWAGRPWPHTLPEGDGGAQPAHLGAGAPLPVAYWGVPSGLACLDHVVASVWREGYSHHITRLMILGNLATLLDLSPRELTDWFWVAYTDAYDWVVEPNVLAMATFSTGDLMTTKPYVAGAAYIDRMSDYCEGCRFHPKKSCPVTSLYWDFLARHRRELDGNPRLAQILASADRRPPLRRREDARVFAAVRDALAAGHEVTPEGLAKAASR